MNIDIFSLEPTKVSRDLRGKIATIYGAPKTGKTTIATKFPKSLLLGFEKGYNALAGIKAQPIQSWADFRKVLNQLKKPQAKELYQTIIIDTADIAYELAEKFICQREDVDKVGDIPYGGGHKLVRAEFQEALRLIPLLDYGLVMISHAQTKTFTDEEGKEYSKIVPTLSERPRQIVLGMSDIVGYARTVEKNGEQQTVLYLRETTRFEAGSRFKYTPPVIPFNYEALVNAIADAIEKEAEEKGQNAVTDEHVNVYKEVNTYDYEEIMREATEIIQELMSKDESNASKITKIIEEHLGKGRKLAETTEGQAEIVALIVDDLKELLDDSE